MRAFQPQRKPWRGRQAFPPTTVRSLQITAARALVLYRKLASDPMFAARLAGLLRRGNPLLLQTPIQRLYAVRIGVTGAGGFFVCASRPTPTNCFGLFSVGPSLSLTPNASEMRSIALAVIPLYRRIVANRGYALRIVRAVNAGNSARLSRIVRETTNPNRLVRVEVVREQPAPNFEADIGFQLVFRFRNNRLFQSILA